jgi:hypothetical protein
MATPQNLWPRHVTFPQGPWPNEGIWSNAFEAIDAERSGMLPDHPYATFDNTFPQANLITSQVADWISQHLNNPDDNPLQQAVEYASDELALFGHAVTPMQALAEITRTYVESNDELFWEETRSPDALIQLDDCNFRALTFYFALPFAKLWANAQPAAPTTDLAP